MLFLLKDARLQKGEIELAEKMGLIREIVYEVLGEEPEISREGGSYFFLRKSGEPCKLKISQTEKAQPLEMEAALFNFIQKETSLPIPRVLGSGNWGTLFYLLHSYFSGPVLEEVLLGNKNVDKLLFSAGQLLGILHSIELHRGGILKPDLSIKEFTFSSRQEYRKKLEFLLIGEYISRDLFGELQEIDIDFFFMDKPVVLCHGTFTPSNLFTGEKEISGIAGWDCTRAEPPFIDLASFELGLEELAVNISPTPFYDGYSRIKPLPSIYLEYEEFYKFYRLLEELTLLRGKKQVGKKLELLLFYARQNGNWPRCGVGSAP